MGKPPFGSGLARARRDPAGGLGRTITNRAVQALLTILGASVLVWALLPLAPGDPARRVLQARGVEEPRPAQIVAVRTELGLDRSLPEQYLAWLGRAIRGDLSTSYRTGHSVAREIGQRLPATALLAGGALLIALLLTLPTALVAVAWHGRWPDLLIRLGTQIGATTPSFLLGLVALHLVVVELGWGQVVSGGRPEHVWLPAATLALGRAAEWTQLLRANLIEALGARYALVATARGATPLRILLRYALPNALLPFLTAVGVGIGALLGGAPIVEAVFTWPGLGSYVVQAIVARDMAALQGVVAVAAVAFVATSTAVDLAAPILDPRLRSSSRSGSR